MKSAIFRIKKYKIKEEISMKNTLMVENSANENNLPKTQMIENRYVKFDLTSAVQIYSQIIDTLPKEDIQLFVQATKEINFLFACPCKSCEPDK